jgi:ABC-2 type transport system ATP-binding protein
VNANLIKDQIIELKNNGTTIILSTHRMESVEEMCDYVALIDNSKKIIDGRVFDVREKFKKNIFGITLSEVNDSQMESFKNKYEIFNMSNENNLVSFDLKNESNQNNIILDLVNVGKVRSFDERIPSMNEVFINAVSNNS